jgi:hypothetical protein
VAEVLEYRSSKGQGGPAHWDGRATALAFFSVSELLLGVGLCLLPFFCSFDPIFAVLGGLLLIGLAALCSAVGLGLSLRARADGFIRQRVLTARWVNGVVLGVTMYGASLIAALCAMR